MPITSGFMTGPQRRRPANLSLPEGLLAEARRLGINVSQASQEGIEAKVREAWRAEWLAQNGGALDAANRFVEDKGLPLGRFRQF